MLEPKDFSSSLIAVLLPDGYDVDAFRAGVLKQFNMSLGNGLSRWLEKSSGLAILVIL